MPSTLAEAPKPDNEDSEQPEQDAAEEDDDTTGKNGSGASRLNAIVGAATFLSNTDPNCKQQMVEIVKKEFYDFTGFVSTVTCMLHTDYLFNCECTQCDIFLCYQYVVCYHSVICYITAMLCYHCL